jgi:hypothetical protein
VIWLVDDAHLGRVLRGRPPSSIAPEDQIATTGLWYVRLCQALLARDQRGALSTPFEDLDVEQRRIALLRVLELPAEISVPSLRRLGPLIGDLRRRHAVNLLASEALAAAVHLDATVLLSTTSPPLEAALTTEGRRVVVDAS